MIDFIQGKLHSISPTEVVVEALPFGYRIQISLNTHQEIKDQENIKLFTHLHVKNEGQNLSGYDLYGFATELERDYFKTIISVSGIGTSTARLMLSSLQPTDINRAIMLEDVTTITKIKGIGPKTAKRMILELKDKLPQNHVDIVDSTQQISTPLNNTIESEALSALVMLGFGKNQAQKTINSILKNSEVSSVEQLIKLSLQKL